MNLLAKRIKEERLKAGLSQKELAKRAGISQPVISDIENGNQSSTKFLPAIAKALNKKISELDPVYGKQWENVENTINKDEINIKNLLSAVESSYHMFGLSPEQSAAVLKIVVQCSKEHPTPSAGPDFYRIVTEIAVRQFLNAKRSQ